MPKYIEGIDFQPAKTPKGKNAPIGYEAPKPKPKPNTGFFTNMKSTKKNLDLTKEEPPKSRETGNSQVLLPPAPKPPKTKKKASTGPTDPLLDVTITDSPFPTGSSSNKAPIVPPVLSYKEEQKKVNPKSIKSQSSITALVTGQVIQPKAQQKIVSGIRPVQTSRQTPRTLSRIVQTSVIVQATPQKIVSTIKPIQAKKTPTSPKPRSMLRVRPMFRTRPIQAQSQPIPAPSRLRAAAVFGPSKRKSETPRTKKSRKTKDFLGNTRLDNIIGLFKREEVIYGDKKTAKQLKRDKKFKEGKKKKRNIKTKKSFGQRIGIVNKGFKI